LFLARLAEFPGTLPGCRFGKPQASETQSWELLALTRPDEECNEHLLKFLVGPTSDCPLGGVPVESQLLDPRLPTRAGGRLPNGKRHEKENRKEPVRDGRHVAFACPVTGREPVEGHTLDRKVVVLHARIVLPAVGVDVTMTSNWLAA
jgi:hypothetical protein